MINELDSSDEAHRTVDAECPGETVVLGGGYWTDFRGVDILASLPVDGGAGWRVEAVGSDPDYLLRVYAICGLREPTP